jgi:hypothetical protein
MRTKEIKLATMPKKKNTNSSMFILYGFVVMTKIILVTRIGSKANDEQ